MLGYNENGGEFYEGSSCYGSLIDENPILYPMNLILSENQTISGFSGEFYKTTDLVFRELSYDPVSNIRRGFCYSGWDSQPCSWRIRGRGEPIGSYSHEERLITFQPKKIVHQLRNASMSQPLVCLGNENGFTVGALVNIETTVTGREIITLKMRQLFGVFPTLKKNYPTPESYKQINSELQNVKDSYYGSLPRSVVDRCRDAASVILGIFNDQPKKDLGAQIKILQKFEGKSKRRVVEAAADIIRILHSRGKPSEKAMRNGLPELVEQDAELAVQCLGTIIRDLDYGEWADAL